MFYLTPSIVPSRCLLREMIENSGGKVTAKRKSLKAITLINQNNETNFIVIACTSDLHLVSDMLKHKLGQCPLYYIYNNH